MDFWAAALSLPGLAVIFLFLALLLAFGFEFINGFHDTANAVTTVIYTRSLKATPAVIYSGLLNFLGVFAGGVGVAYGILNLLPPEVVQDTTSNTALVMVVALLLSAVTWNLGTWYLGLPVSSSHTLIGSILGVGLAYGLLAGKGIEGVKWDEATKVGLGLIWSPLFGGLGSFALLWLMKRLIRSPKLYLPPEGDDLPPMWIRGILIFTCGAVSFTHGSNDGQKGIGLIMLILIGFLAGHYALNTENDAAIGHTREGVTQLKDQLDADWAALEKAKAANWPSEDVKKDGRSQLERVARHIGDKTVLKQIGDEKPFELSPDEKDAALDHVQTRTVKVNADINDLLAKLSNLKSFRDVQPAERLELREQIYRIADVARRGNFKVVRPEFFGLMMLEKPLVDEIKSATDWTPFWVVLGVALALGVGTTIGYERIVKTVAEKIGKTHLTYAQGMAAELVAALTIFVSTQLKVPVSTTQVLNSGIAGTMAANGSGLQYKTVLKILLAWVFTLPCAMLLGGTLYWFGKMIVRN